MDEATNKRGMKIARVILAMLAVSILTTIGACGQTDSPEPPKVADPTPDVRGEEARIAVTPLQVRINDKIVPGLQAAFVGADKKRPDGLRNYWQPAIELYAEETLKLKAPAPKDIVTVDWESGSGWPFTVTGNGTNEVTITAPDWPVGSPGKYPFEVSVNDVKIDPIVIPGR